MFVARSISADHKDLIHDVAYDFHGRRMATCSSDQSVKVWDLGEDGQWHCTADWKATCSADGLVRIYEAPDVMNLSQWQLQHAIQCKLSCSCLAWNPSRVHPPMLAVGSDDANPSAGGKVIIYEFSEAQRKWNKVETVMIVTEPVYDIAFAPNLGRSYHMLGVGSKDVHVITLKPLKRELAVTAPPQGSSTQATGMSRFEIRQVAQFCDHYSQVWRISWNITGTILASSGDDGCVRLWKANYLDNWKCISVLKGDGTRSPTDRPGGQGAMQTSNVQGVGNGTRYYKLGGMLGQTATNQVVWH
ncbi:PREDICTED: nucleoporin seh1-like isoform X2 [Priapulus caudatus]|uniref:Nucleoporin seh1-like isoform X2 n=1 Tax=Priapulus caudatus TaxID=37621 RepID=A0ABM1DPS6_PRICU|nr:PREDICTED: nucleoporin seh1-like isoform X2 [Priapulus caudatus]